MDSHMLRHVKSALNLRTRVRYLKLALLNLGLRSSLLFWYQRVRMKMTSGNLLVSLRSKYARHPLKCRANTSDFPVFRQIFIEREYSCIDAVVEIGLVIDCGANVGYSSAYFLSRYPGCDLIAIEPDPTNFEILRLNLAPYGTSVRMLRSAVWSHPTKLGLSEKKYRDGYQWTRQVRECAANEDSNLLAVDIATLLRESGHHRISILKVDIEGAEAVVFSKNYESWIDKVDILLIELHDDSSFGNSSAIFEKAIAGRGFSVTQCGKLTVCKQTAMIHNQFTPTG